MNKILHEITSPTSLLSRPKILVPIAKPFPNVKIGGSSVRAGPEKFNSNKNNQANQRKDNNDLPMFEKLLRWPSVQSVSPVRLRGIQPQEKNIINNNFPMFDKMPFMQVCNSICSWTCFYDLNNIVILIFILLFVAQLQNVPPLDKNFYGDIERMFERHELLSLYD